ncbi:L-2-hydroxyglutarate oxidase [Cryobacterium sp. Y11]|uniref:L-2-hydroxyglutarate oxidase n=1 Tax=Cryobacterium sp. Y11 TaxID=2045016 RepID=UPI000CE45C88|nr:L-2-hydroxyglutarate oxidase [Cryobacterium sp. Y11]
MEDLIVIGAGIVGLATAREALRRRPGISVLVLEKADDVASAQTGHNSGVIHAGLYYAPGSLKARLCRAGEKATKDFCDEHGIHYETVGKLVVATDDVEIERLKALAERAAENGIKVEHINRDRLAEMEPNVRGREALISPATGIVDFRDVAHAMARDIEQMGGRVITRSQVRSIDERSGASGKVVVGSDTGEYQTRQLVACAGLQADRVATMGGLDIDFQIIPFRGEYYQLPHDRWGIVQRLIYPVPDPDLPFLGVHLSPTIDGRITVGPNAVLGFSRERYPRGSITGRDVARFLAFPGMWRFAMNNIQTGVEEMRSSYFPRGYLKLVRKYCPGLELADLRPYPAGIRAQAIMRDGTSVEDFLFRSTDHQLHVCNAPSPAATSAIPIGALIVDKILGSDRD